MDGFYNLSEADKVQIRKAAQGTISGDLKQLPALNAALTHVGFELAPGTSATALQDLCKFLVANA